MISQGRHPAKAIDGPIFGKAETGTEQVAITFRILGGQFKDHEITWIGFFSPKATKHTLKALAVCGWPSGKELDELSIDDLGSLVSLVVEHEEYKGQPRARVQWVNRPGVGGFQMKHEIVGSDLRKLAARYKADGKATARYEPIDPDDPENLPDEPAGNSQPPPRDYGDPGPMDDIPF